MSIRPGAPRQTAGGADTYRPLERTETDIDADTEQQTLASSGINDRESVVDEQEFSKLVADLHAFAEHQLDQETVEVGKSAALAVTRRRFQHLADMLDQGVGADGPPVSFCTEPAGTPPHLQYLADTLDLEVALSAEGDRFVFSYAKGRNSLREAPTWFEHEVFAALADNKHVYIPIYFLLCTSPFLTSWGSVME
jgi:hypothetical protein